MIVSMSGETYRPWKTQSSPVLQMIVNSAGSDFGGQPFDQFGAAGAAGENDDHHESPGIDGVLECWSVGKFASGPPFLTKPSAPQSCST